jgi:hypothetical protein
MNLAYRVMLLRIAFTWCCFCILPLTIRADSPTPEHDHSAIVFIVASCTSDQLLAEVKITMIAADGSETEWGPTDGSGKWSMGKAFLRSQHARYLLFSHPGFSIGAVRVDDALLSSDQRGIDLAPFIVY